MKRFFLRGLGALLPLVLTLWIFLFIFSFLYSNIGVPIGEGIRWGMGKLSPLLLEAIGEQSKFFPLAGFVVGFLLTFVCGFLVATFFGKGLLKLLEGTLKRLPVVRIIYPYAKQFTDFLFSGEEQKKMEFKNAVAVPFPAPGMYSIGFITSEGLRTINEAGGKHFACVFLPTAPTPFTGFVVYVPREEIVPLPISVDEAFRIIISAGVLTPPHQTVSIGDLKALPHLPFPTLPPKPV